MSTRCTRRCGRTARTWTTCAAITATLDAAGLDSRAILALSQDPEVKATLLANTQRAHDRGAFGSPSFLIGRELWFGKDRLRDVEEAILAGAVR